MVLTARVDAGCPQRAGPPGQLTARSGQTAQEGTGWTPPTGRVQAVVATWPVSVDRRNPSSASAGVFQPRVLRGLPLRAVATAARSSALCTLRSVPFGKDWRSSPLVFSFVPRCQGL